MSSSKAINRDDGKSPRGSSALDRLSNTQSSHGSDVCKKKTHFTFEISLFLIFFLSFKICFQKKRKITLFFICKNRKLKQLNRKSLSGLNVPTGNFFRKLADGSWVNFSIFKKN